MVLAGRSWYWQIVSLAVMEVQRQVSRTGACPAPHFPLANIIDDQTVCTDTVEADTDI